MRRKILEILAILCIVPSTVYATGFSPDETQETTPCVVGHSLNDEQDNIDYKVAYDEFISSWDCIGLANSTIEFPASYQQNRNGLSDDTYTNAAKAYLIENNVLSRPTDIEWVNDHFDTTFDEGWMRDDAPVLKSDVYMMLYKSVFGTLNSNTLLLKPGNSDYYLYTSPDVYELYLNSLLDKGLIVKSDLITDSEFLKDYNENSIDSRPIWYANDDYRLASVPMILGQTFTYADTSIKRSSPMYFKQENMDMLELLESIEKFMRFTEKDMTKSEANIIAYKYGVTYLSGLTDDEYDTVAFLIAKGIINLEDDSLDFFADPTYADVYKLIYRVANPDARYDFSKIQLTDGEAFWQSKGYSSENFDLFFVDNSYIFQTESVQQMQQQALSGLFVSAASSTSEYSVVKVFDKVNTYTYHGKKIGELYELSEDSRKTSYPEIVNIEDTTEKDVSIYRVTFKIQATSAKRAVQIVDSKLTCNIKDSTSYSVSAVTKVGSDGKEVRLISQSALRKCFGDTIEVVEDKVLRNVNTGAMACLLQDSGYALVGNEVVISDDILVTDASNDIYYNLDVIASLLNVQIDNMYASDTTKVATINNPHSASLTSSFTTDLGSVEYLGATTQDDGDVVILNDFSSAVSDYTYFYNVNQVSNGINTIWRKFYKDIDSDGKPETFIVIVDWYYCVPDLKEFNLSPWYTVENDSAQYTLSEAFTGLYTEPANSALKQWWQSNLGVSNALANMIFGTSNVEYVKCGYMMPSVTVLLPPNCTEADKASTSLSKLLVEFGFTLPGKYQSFVGGSTNNFMNAYFNNAAGITNDTVKSFAQSNRHFKVYIGNPYEWDTGTIYGNDFYVSGSGVLYRSLSEDYARFAYTVNSDYTLSNITVRDRVKCGSDAIPTGTVVTYKNKNFYYAGTYESGTGTYLRLVPLDDQKILPRLSLVAVKGKEDAQYFVNYPATNGYTSLHNQITHFYELYFDRMASDLASDSNLRVDIICGDFSKTFCTDSAVAKYFDTSVVYGETFKYYVGGNGSEPALYKNKNKEFKLFTTAKKGNTYNALGIPYLYLPAGSYYLYNATDSSGNEYCTLGKGIQGYALNMTNIRYSGVIDGVIDSILAKSVSTTEVKNLSSGTKLIIGDTVWTKSGKVWLSDPILNSDLATYSKKGHPMTALQKIFSCELVANDGIYTSLGKYITSADVSSANIGKVPANSGCVCKNQNGELSVYLNGEYKSVDSAAEYAVVSATFDDSMLVRAMTADGTVYRFCNSATESVVSGTEYPFFNEQLSYSTNAKDMMALSQSSYEMTAVYNLKKDEFNAEYKKQWFEDFTTLVRMFIVIAASWLMVISWIVYWTVSKGYGVRVLEALAGKSRFGKDTGVDLVKLISLGVYNLESPPVFTRILIVTIVCVIIDAICLALG